MVDQAITTLGISIAMIVGLSIIIYIARKLYVIVAHGIAGMFVLFIANSLNIGIGDSTTAYLVSAVGGLTGSLILIILHYLGVIPTIT